MIQLPLSIACICGNMKSFTSNRQNERKGRETEVEKGGIIRRPLLEMLALEHPYGAKT
jgi:hypothetical protein